MGKQGKSLNKSQIKKVRDPILEKYEVEGNPYYSTARLWDDGVQRTFNQTGIALEFLTQTYGCCIH
jgi:acetyl-CoA carboxylase carboxyltransferase component